MDLIRIIQQLRDEREKLDQIIVSLEQLHGTTVKLRTRDRRGRRSMDADARAEVSERMKRYWASQRDKPDPENRD